MEMKQQLLGAHAPRSERMYEPDDVAVMLRLHAQGWGLKRIAVELGVARNTVRRYLRAGRYEPYTAPSRVPALAAYEDWLRATFLQHHWQRRGRASGARAGARCLRDSADGAACARAVPA